MEIFKEQRRSRWFSPKNKNIILMVFKKLKKFNILLSYQEKGFSIMELLMVVAIIGTLAGIILAPLTDIKKEAKDARIHSDMNQLRNEAEVQFTEDGDYDDVDGTKGNFVTIYNDIIKQGGKNFAIYRSASSSAEQYCSEVQLNDGKWCCVDYLVSGGCDYETDPVCSSSHFSCK